MSTEICMGSDLSRGVVLNFFFPWCRICQKAASSFDNLNKEIKQKDIVILHVDTEAGEKDLIKFKNEFHISLPMLIDENGSVARAYRV